MKRTINPPSKKGDSPKKAKHTDYVLSFPHSSLLTNPLPPLHGIKMLKTLIKSDPKGTVVISPLSIDSAFRLLGVGTEGSMLQELQDFFVWPRTEKRLCSDWVETARKLSKVDSAVQMVLANSVWINGEPNPEYVNTVKNEISSSVFKLPKNAKPINKWVSDNTNGLIPEVLADVSGLDAVLINAVYFKGNWTNTFKKSMTYKSTFTNGKDTKPIDMMCRDAENWSYFKGTDFQVIDLPYGPNELFVASVVLPSHGIDINSFIAQFDDRKLKDIEARNPDQEGVLHLPSFKVEFSKDLVTPLQQNGISGVFAGPITRIASGPLKVSSVVHKVVIIVNEEGTEAAAVTAICLDEFCVMGGPIPFSMICDRPFLFLIRERTSGSTLFMGKIDLSQ